MDKSTKMICCLVAVVLVGLLAMCLLNKFPLFEKFEAGAPINEEACGTPKPSEMLGENETFQKVSESVDTVNKLPKDCYPKDNLQPEDLLPKDANSKWAQVNPAGQGDLKDQNFLSAGSHMGVNTVGQTLRNPNYQIRSEPANPQNKVSPWMQTTIEPDSNRRELELGQA